MRLVGWSCAALLAIGSTATLTGWLFDLDWMRDPVGYGRPMKVNTALVLTVYSMSLLVVRQWPTKVPARLGAVIASAVSVAVGLATLAAYGFGWSLSIDEIVRHDPMALPGLPPGRPAPQAAFAMVCLGVALAFSIRHADRRSLVRDIASAAALGVAVLALVGPATGSTALFSIGTTYPIPVSAALLLALAAAATVLTLAPGQTACFRLANMDPGGVLLRSLIPMIVALAAAGGIANQVLGLNRPADPTVAWIVTATAVVVLVAGAARIADSVDRIDARRRAEAAKVAMLVTSLADAVVVVNQSGRVEAAYGPAWAGRDAGLLLGRTLAELSNRGEESTAAQDATRLALSGTTANFDFSSLLPDGNRHHFGVRVAPMLGTDDSVAGAVALARDVTDLRDAEVSARAAEERYRSVFDGVGEGIFRISSDGRILLANKAMATMLGYGCASELTASVQDAASCFVRATDYRSIFHVADSGDSTGEPVQLRRRDGGTIWAKVAAVTSVDEDGRPDGVRGVIQDVTASYRTQRQLRDAQERLHAAFHGSPHGRVVVDVDRGSLRLGEANVAFEKLVGLSRADLLGRDLVSLIAPGEQRQASQQFARCLDGTEPNTTFRSTLCSEGHTIPVQVSASLVRSTSGPEYFVVIVEDITQQLRAEEQRDEALSVADRRAAHAHSLAMLARTAIGGVNVRTFLNEVAAVTKATLGADFCGIVGLRPDGSLQFEAGSGWDRRITATTDRAVGKGALAAVALKSKFPLLVDDWEVERRFEPSTVLRAHGARSSLSMAIRGGTTAFGVLGVHTKALRHFDGTDVAFAEAVAHILGLVLSRQHASEALEQSHKTMQTLIDNAPAAIYLLDSDGRIQFLNREVERIFQVRGEEVVGKTTDAIPSLAGELGAILQNRDLAVLATGVAQSGEDVIEQADGSHTYLSVKFPILDERRCPVGVGGVATDITAMKRAQAELESLLVERTAQASEQAAVVALGTAALTGANTAQVAAEALAAMVETLGIERSALLAYSPADDTLVVHSMYPADSATGRTVGVGAAGEWSQMMRAAGPTQLQLRSVNYAEVFGVSDGRRASAWVAVKVGQRTIGGVLLCSEDAVRDFSDHEMSFLASVGNVIGACFERDELDKMKSSFVSTVSHELRTPLTSVLGYLEMLQSGDAGAISTEQAGVLSVIERNGKRLRSLIEDLLTTSRMESGSFALNMAPVEAKRLIASVLDGIAGRLTDRKLDVTVDLPVKLQTIWGDAEQLERALLNVAVNAVKFTPDGGRITIRARDAAGTVDLEVEDTGIGIPQDEQVHLFERFFRASTAQDAQIQGTGLGLSIVKSIVDHHGGSIEARSQPGLGTTVRLSLLASGHGV